MNLNSPGSFYGVCVLNLIVKNSIIISMEFNR